MSVACTVFDNKMGLYILFFLFREREKERRRDDDMMVLFPCCPRVCDTTNVNATQQQCFVICVATDLIREAKGSKCNLEI